MRLLSVLACALAVTSGLAAAADYTVKIYLDEAKATTAPSASVTWRNTSGLVVKTIKSDYATPVVSLPATAQSCRIVGIKNSIKPSQVGVAMVCDVDPVASMPEIAQITVEPK